MKKEKTVKDMSLVKSIASPEEFEKLILENQNFAYNIVNKEFGKYSWDVRQELNSAAIEGLVYAATKYDPKREKECKFISYAVHWIRYYVQEEIRKLYPVKFNQNFVCKRKKVTNFISKYQNTHDGETPTVKEISANVDMSEKVVQGILNVNGGENFTFLSFNAPVDVGDSTNNEMFTENKLVNEYLKESIQDANIESLELQDLLEALEKEVPALDYKLFYEYYINGESFSNLAKKYKMKFPSSVSYLIKKCEKKCKELLVC